MNLFDPARLPMRDETGFTSHPDIPETEEEVSIRPYLADLGYDVRGTFMSEDHDDDSEQFKDYYEREPFSCSTWQPMSPEGWQLISIHDTEDGPVALFVRPILPELLERNRALRELDMAWARAQFPTAQDEVLLAGLHKARYECLHIHDALRQESREWLADNNMGRNGGRPLLPIGRLPSEID